MNQKLNKNRRSQMSQNKRKMNNKPPKKNSTSPNRMIISKNKLENIKVIFIFCECLLNY